MAHIYFHSGNKEKENAIRKLCAALDIDCTTLAQQDLSRTVGAITGIPAMGVPRASSPAQTPALFAMPDCILFSRLSNDLLDAFLNGYKGAGIAPTPLKAVATPTNLQWTLFALLGELTREHAAVTKGKR